MRLGQVRLGRLAWVLHKEVSEEHLLLNTFCAALFCINQAFKNTFPAKNIAQLVN